VLRERVELAVREPWRPLDFFTLAGQRERAERVAAREATGACLARVIREDDTLAGTVGLELDGDGLGAGTAELGYWVARAYRGRGLATEAGRLILNEAWQRGVRRVRANTQPDNHASRAVLRRLGFSDDAEEVVLNDGAAETRYFRYWLALNPSRRATPPIDPSPGSARTG
jgi:RimJ/RimL family protein N-acetyltransferase